MSEAYIGEIRMWGLTFAPVNWGFCNGQPLPISSNQALHAVMQGAFGYNSTTLFLPDLRGRVPMHSSQVHPVGQAGGVETVPLTTNQMPTHNHDMQAATNTATQKSPSGHYLAAPAYEMYGRGTMQPMRDGAVAETGGNGGHDNMQPSIVLNFCIALSGVFPPRN